MKVVLFCGGFGTRLREYSETIPKPLVDIGYRPIIWHLMKYYAHFGHNDFILALGYRGDLIKEYFLKYDECMSNDFILRSGGKDIELLNSDIDDWNITFCDTGLNSNIGQRLLRVRHLLKDEDVFLANYSDGLSDIPLDKQIAKMNQNGAVASFACVRPSYSLSAVQTTEDGTVTGIKYMSDAEIRINGGFMILRSEIFNYINEGEELVEEPFERLIDVGKLNGYKYDGFWSAMDTFKDKTRFDEMVAEGRTPWQVWEKKQD
jgi:glucose-1-phosphate cytidylyltransferase